VGNGPSCPKRRAAGIRQRGRWLAGLCLGLALQAFGAETPPSAPATTTNTPPLAEDPGTNRVSVVNVQAPTSEGLNAEIAKIEADSGLDAKLKQTLLDHYRAASELLAAAEQNRQKAAALQAAIGSVPEEVNRLRQEIEALEVQAQAETNRLAGVNINGPLPELEQLLTRVKGEADASKAQLSKDEEALENRRKRPTSAIAEKNAAQEELRAAESELAAPVAPDVPPAVVRARRVLLEARRIAAGAEIAMIDQDLLAQSTQVDLLTARRSLRTRQIALGAQRQKALEQLVERRRSEAAQADRERTAQMQRDTLSDESAHPLIKELADENAALGDQRAAVLELNRRVSRTLEAEQEVQRQLEVSSESSRKQIEAAGLSETLAEILLVQRRRLESPRAVRRRMEDVREMTSTNALAQLLVDEELRKLVVLRDHLQVLLAERDDLPEEEAKQAALEEEGLEFLKTRQELLGGLQQSYGQLMKELQLLAGVQTTYLKDLEEYIGFLDEILMWTPSSAPLGLATLRDLPPALEWWTQPDHWNEAVDILGQRLSRSYAALGFLVILLLGLLVIRKRLLRLQDDVAVRTRRAANDSFQLTLKVLPVPILLAAPLPLVFGMIGLPLLSDVQAMSSEFVSAIGTGFSAMGLQSLLTLGIYELCRPGGLGHVHFRWKEENLQLVRRNIRWYLPLLLLVRFVTASSQVIGSEGSRESLGQILFLAGMGAGVVIVWRVVHPDHGIFRYLIRQRPKGLLARTRWLWFGLLLAHPVGLSVLAGMGYFYTALQLNIRTTLSVAMILAISLVYNLVIRWLFVRERHLALEQAMEKRANAIREEEVEADDKSGFGPIEEPEVSLGTIKTQTRQLLRVSLTLAVLAGLWVVWESELPALNYLHNFKLWSVTVGAEGASKLMPITLADALGAILVAMLTAVAARNLPGLLEIVVLQNLSLLPGSRYAITAISQYLVVALGTIITLGALGVRWSQLGWIAAALSVGLGFGLQEVVANFVCGILLFLERPVRVGDVVTVGDVTGVVSRIQIRATTVTNWERQEFIVPNREFITGRILNWTLSNPVNRVTVQVGVAYGSDVDRTREALQRAVEQQPLVLADPKPMVHFVGFGDSTLNFAVRVYLPDLDNRLSATHEVNRAIYLELARAGIEIAFPQRDIHVRSVEPVLRLGRSARKDSPGREAK
jgi:potassium efflux system protein